MMKSFMEKRRSLLKIVGSCIAAASLSVLVAGCGGDDDNDSGRWVASWHAAQQDYNEVFPTDLIPPPTPVTVSNQTIRQIVHVSLGGQKERLKLSNLFGTTEVTFTSVRVAESAGDGAIDTSTDTPVTFGGAASVTVAAGEEVWSDTVELDLAAGADIAVSVFVEGSVPLATVHTLGQQTNYLGAGDQTGSESLTDASTVTSYYWLSDVDVSTGDDDVKVVVAFGDSITDGFASTVSANHRWPNDFDARLRAAGNGSTSVVNAGISGNRWLHDVIGPAGAGRFERDVNAVSGATHVVILLGINDIGFGVLVPDQKVTSDQIIDALSAAIDQAKAKGLKVVVGTLLPYQGALYYDAAGESARQAVNAFVRSATGIDGVVDFDAAMRDPANPASLLPDYDSGDHLHPNDAGYQAMADAVDLSLVD